MAIRLIRLYTGDDGQSHSLASEIEWDRLDALNAVSRTEPAQDISFEETRAPASIGTMPRIAST